MERFLRRKDFSKENLEALHEELGLPKAFYFEADEFECPHCGKVLVSRRVYEALTRLRFETGAPVIVTSGYRCSEYNRRIGGVPQSAHTKGLAADVLVRGSGMRFDYLRILLELGVERLGIAEDFIHLDFDYSKPYPVVWTYGPRRHVA